MAVRSGLVDFKIVGAKELERALAQLPKSLSKGVLRRALVKAATPIAQDAARNALGRAGGPERGQGAGPHLSDSLKVSTVLTKRQRRARMKRGAAEIYAGSIDPKAHLLEFGHIARDGSRVKAYPFLRPAWDANKGRALETLKEEIWVELRKAAKRLRRKADRLLARIGGLG